MKIKEQIRLENVWRTNGKHYGYPQCCIDEFVEGRHQGHPTNLPVIHNYQGFIPCEKHRQEILDNKITIEELIKDRQCSTPYPIDEYDQN